LLFQTLDNKKECYAIYCDKDFYYYPNKLDLTHTWSYTPHFENKKIEYANIWCTGANLDSACPEHLKEDWSRINKKARAYLTSFDEARINLDDICFYDAVPRKFLVEYCDYKNQITDWVFHHYKKPKNYDFLNELVIFLHKLGRQEMNLQTTNLDFINPKVRKSFDKIKNSSNRIIYDPWVTATGRLTTTQNSFPILTLNKELRHVLAPCNNLFMELDYNSAELRTFFGLSGQDQPAEDIHAWINSTIFNNKYTREECKKKVFAWLYNPKAKNAKLNKYLDRDSLLNKLYIDGHVETPYQRRLNVCHSKALNYLIQSTTSDLFLTSVLKVDKMLKNRKSFISFCIHDSLVIDFHKSDRSLVNEILKIFSATKFGDFKINLSIGNNFGNMKKVL